MHKVSSVGSSQLQKHSSKKLHDLLAGTQQYTVAGGEVTDVDGMPFASSVPQQFGCSERTGGLTKFGFNSLGNMLSSPKYPGRRHESTAETTKILMTSAAPGLTFSGDLGLSWMTVSPQFTVPSSCLSPPLSVRHWAGPGVGKSLWLVALPGPAAEPPLLGLFPFSTNPVGLLFTEHLLCDRGWTKFLTRPCSFSEVHRHSGGKVLHFSRGTLSVLQSAGEGMAAACGLASVGRLSKVQHHKGCGLWWVSWTAAVWFS